MGTARDRVMSSVLVAASGLLWSARGPGVTTSREQDYLRWMGGLGGALWDET